MQYDKISREEAVHLSDKIGLKNTNAHLDISYYNPSG